MSFEVSITEDCFFACLTHALTSEKEEIMGLLFGNIEEGHLTKATVWDVCTLTRSDKRKDRVEIASEQLVYATTEAERLSEKENFKTRVIGWYHSHPKITPWPSEVDLSCQQNYQLLEKGFVGLIFSVYNTDSVDMKYNVQLHAFRSKNGEKESVAVNVIPSSGYPCRALERIISLQEVFLAEEQAEFKKALGETTSNKVVNPLKSINFSAEYMKRLTRLIQNSCAPLKTVLQDELVQNQRKIQELEQEEKMLQMKLMQLRI